MTFICVVLCWVFFRAENVAQALDVIASMTDIYNLGLPDKGTIYNYAGFLADYGIVFSPWLFKDSLPKILITLSIVMAAVLLVPNPLKLLENKLLFRYGWLPILLGLLAGLSLLMVNIGNSEFLYFQF